MDSEKQLGRLVYRAVSSIMKNTLNLEELSYRESGRNDPRYRTFKKHLMEFTYNELRDLLDELAEWKLIVSTGDDEDCSNGYRDNLSGGAGFVNTEALDKFFEEK
jgi:hypothetical protein